jgi:hypothetical protein
MADTREPWVDVPDPSKIEEKGISIDAPTPVQFVIPDPWQPQNGNSGDQPPRNPAQNG